MFIEGTHGIERERTFPPCFACSIITVVVSLRSGDTLHQHTPLDPSSSKQDQEIQDLCREILMVHIAEEPEGDPTEHLNFDDYNSDDFNEYLSDNMETTPTITEAQVTTKDDLPAPPPPPAVTRHRPTR